MPATWDIDPYSDEVLASPQAFYAELRKRGPLVWLERYNAWACGRYEEVKTIFGDWERFCSSRGVGLTDFATEAPWRPPSIILEVDPPEHDRTRAVMMRTLSARAVNELDNAFRAEARAMVGALATGDKIDAVDRLSTAYPLKVFPDAVGLADGDRENLLIYANMVFNALGPDNAIRQKALADAAPIQAWIAERCARASLAPGGFGAAIYGAVDDGEISEEEAGLLVRSLLSAGIDTTVGGLGVLLLCLAQNPEQYALLREDPRLRRNAFEEALRVQSPIHTFCRTAAIDTEVSGVPIKEGDKILCVLWSANTDPAHWDNPDAFDVRRPAAGHLGFGIGPHACVGRQVARLEAQAVLDALCDKIAAIELAGAPVFRPGNALIVLASLPLRLHPA